MSNEGHSLPSATLDQAVVEAAALQGNGDRLAHYAKKHDITFAVVHGTPITAICGKKWVPCRDAAGLAVCARCQELYAFMRD